MASRAGRRLRRLLASQEVRFPLAFLGLAVALWLAWEAVGQGAMAGFRAATARLVAGGAALTGLAAEVRPGSVLAFAGGAFTYHVTDGCTAWMALLLYSAAVLAYPATWVQRARGLALGTPLVLALNVARLVSMAWIGVRWPALFAQAHDLWWQACIVLAVGLGWLAWARHVEDGRRDGPPAAGRGRAWALTVAVGIVIATVAALEFLGTATGAITGYGRALRAAALAWTSALGLHAVPASLDSDADRLYGGLAAVVGLYLATPRVRLRDRLLGAATWGVLAQAAIDAVVVGWTLVALSGHGGRDDAYILGQTLSRGGGVAVWVLWARRHWTPTDAPPSSFPCPACGAGTTDPLAHIAQAHPDNPRKWTRQVVRSHPELRGHP